MNDNQQDMLNLMTSRAAVYRLLSGFYLEEITDETFKALQAADLPADAEDPLLKKGWEELAAFLKNPPENAVEELACDYARVFLGAGCINETVAYPFESVYTNPQKLVCQEACEAVTKLMRAEGLKKAKDDLFEDHAALEFSLMAHWCDKAVRELKAGNETAYERAVEQQAVFVEKHLLNWMPAFLADIRACGRTDFYKAAADITEGWLAEEKALFSL